MTKTRSNTRKGSHDASTRKGFKNCENGVAVPWSNIHRDLLFLVMMQLGLVDFDAFSGVYKSWRLLALSNKKMFMASRPPMPMSVSADVKQECYCYLEDFEGKTFKILLPHSSGRTCVGLTSGYLILYSWNKDFLLANPITRHQLRFPPAPFPTAAYAFRAILVFSTSISRWVFLLVNSCSIHVWFCIAGEGAWNHFSSTFPIIDLHAFNGRIYTLNIDRHIREEIRHLCEMRLHPEPKLTLLETKNFPERLCAMFASSAENLYVLQYTLLKDSWKVCELDFSETKWVSIEKAREECELFLCYVKYGVVVKPEPWADTGFQYGRYAHDDINGGRYLFTHMWYFRMKV